MPGRMIQQNGCQPSVLYIDYAATRRGRQFGNGNDWGDCRPTAFRPETEKAGMVTSIAQRAELG